MSIGQLPQSFRGYVGIGKESTLGTGVAPEVFADATSDGFELDNQVDFQNTTRGRGTYKGELGALSDEGGVDMPVAPEGGIGYLLVGALGDAVNNGSDPVGEHLFTPADTLPSLSVEVDRDTDVVRHVGAGVDTLELSHSAEDKLTASADLVAQEPDASVSSATPTYSDLRNFRFQDASISMVGSGRSSDVQDFSFSIENGLSAEYRDSRSLTKMAVGERVISATATLDFETTELFEQFLGNSGATSPQDQQTLVAVNATWTSPEVVDTGTQYKLDVNMPACTVNTHSANINQNDLVAEDVDFRALVDSGIGGEVEVTLTNGVTTTY